VAKEIRCPNLGPESGFSDLLSDVDASGDALSCVHGLWNRLMSSESLCPPPLSSCDDIKMQITVGLYYYPYAEGSI